MAKYEVTIDRICKDGDQKSDTVTVEGTLSYKDEWIEIQGKDAAGSTWIAASFNRNHVVMFKEIR